ncbi:OmpA family protein [Niveibacterium sp. 24ML]|uniref:OmpA family protein n=1 Tax=Niveibacterium sp. 24ML TaxID=2985512 RepID=UPI002270D7CA|nr:OmpA family protein [Niveibacterium sp. 24ML]MCX9156026.1 OmpA family protein [Niveibacterium sp. 24ML]
MKQGYKKLVVAFAAVIGLVPVAMAQQQEIKIVPTTKVAPYAIDARNTVVRSGAGLCWRTGYWTKELASTTMVEGSEFPVGCFCDKDLMPKELCEPKKVEVAPEAKPVVPGPKPAAEKVTIAADALFDYDKAVLRDEGKATLTEFAAKAKALSIEVIIAVGHTDRLGGDKYNQALSERRAAAVKEFLVSQQIDPNRVYTEGKGKTQPVTQCKNLGAESGKNKKLVECLQPDRRVEIEVIGTKQ